MPERCAVCGDDDVWKRVTLPDDWESYLVDERGMTPADGYYLLPACDNCGDRVSVHKELSGVMDELDEDTRELLDEVVLDDLVEGFGEE